MRQKRGITCGRRGKGPISKVLPTVGIKQAVPWPNFNTVPSLSAAGEKDTQRHTLRDDLRSRNTIWMELTSCGTSGKAVWAVPNTRPACLCLRIVLFKN